jgi:putative ABC transport system substrate-binding protein
MNRRDLIALLGGAAAWPLAAHAQQGARGRRVGVLMSYLDNDLEAQAWVAAFHQGLQKLGWVEGRNIHSDSRWARGEDTEALQKFARELVALDPHVILSSSTPRHCGPCAGDAQHSHRFRGRRRSGRQRLCRKL